MMRPIRSEALRSVRRPVLAVLALMALAMGHVKGQCLNDNTLTGAAVNVPCPGSITVPCVQGGQYALVNVTAGNIYTFSTCTSGAFDTQITLYNNAGGASLGYNDDACGGIGLQSSVQWTAGFTGQLRVLVDQYNCVSNAICIPLTINCAAPPPPVTNNDPCGVQVLGVTTTCVPSVWSNVGATLTTTPPIPAPGCGNLVPGSADVWFLFIAPPTGIAIIETGAGTLTDAAMALYTATPNCSGTFNLVQCDDDTGPGFMPFLSFNNLIPGQTYYLRVWGYGTATGTFTLCVHGPTFVPPGDCVYMLQLFDSFGDGWGGSNVVVSINGTPVGTYTNNSVYDIFLIGVTIGQVLVVQYNAVGPFEGDNLYTLSYLSSGQVVFTSGTPPAAGITYTTTVTCNPPPATPEDCVGGITLCNSLGINNNTNTTGSVADLNPSNYGCLLASEQQGTWYNFSIANGGTLGMTIDPVAADATFPDYDWAIWGPYPPGSTTSGICPPLGTPIRCSFASGIDSWVSTGGFNTGMGINNLALANPQFGPPLPIYSDPAGGGDGWTPGINVTTGQVYLLYVSNFDNSGQAFNLSWQLGSGASLDCTVLPIDLLAFDAEALGSRTMVTWRTGPDESAEHYTVERSLDGLTFDPVGEVPAASGGSGTTEYQHIDNVPGPGTNYYRLNRMDHDGTSLLSHVISVDFSNVDPIGPGSLFPNPAQQDAWWIVSPALAGSTLEVCDALGRKIASSALTTGQEFIRLDTRNWPIGTVSLRILAADGALRHHATLLIR